METDKHPQQTTTTCNKLQRLATTRTYDYTKKIYKLCLIGGLFTTCVCCLATVALHHLLFEPDFVAQLGVLTSRGIDSHSLPRKIIKCIIPPYWSLFRKNGNADADDKNVLGTRYPNARQQQKLAYWTKNSRDDAQLVIAGKLSVDGSPSSIAQYNLNTNQWSASELIRLTRYRPNSRGEIYSLLVNQTIASADLHANNEDLNHKCKQRSTCQRSGELIVVGSFDFPDWTSGNVVYCSVGKWDGFVFSKMGEGLCNSCLSEGMSIVTAAFVGPQDVYVAGPFQTKVWNADRREFLTVSNIAHYNAITQIWLPLSTGEITCSSCTPAVFSLVADTTRNILHIAGEFNGINQRNIPAGLAIYDLDTGRLMMHPGRGLSMRNRTEDGVGAALQLDEKNGILYVMGSFERLTATDEICLGLAAYEIDTNRWTCLIDEAHAVIPTGYGSMLLTSYGLMVAGKAENSTTWTNRDKPYTIALMKTTPMATRRNNRHREGSIAEGEGGYDELSWSWLPGFPGHNKPLHALSNGFGEYLESVFISGDNLVARWWYRPESGNKHNYKNQYLTSAVDSGPSQQFVAVTEYLSDSRISGSITAISQMTSGAETTLPPPPRKVWLMFSIGIVFSFFGIISWPHLRGAKARDSEHISTFKEVITGWSKMLGTNNHPQEFAGIGADHVPVYGSCGS